LGQARIDLVAEDHLFLKLATSALRELYTSSMAAQSRIRPSFRHLQRPVARGDGDPRNDEETSDSRFHER